jgi:hypothetical protein
MIVALGATLPDDFERGAAAAFPMEVVVSEAGAICSCVETDFGSLPIIDSRLETVGISKSAADVG